MYATPLGYCEAAGSPAGVRRVEYKCYKCYMRPRTAARRFAFFKLHQCGPGTAWRALILTVFKRYGQKVNKRRSQLETDRAPIRKCTGNTQRCACGNPAEQNFDAATRFTCFERPLSRSQYCEGNGPNSMSNRSTSAPVGKGVPGGAGGMRYSRRLPSSSAPHEPWPPWPMPWPTASCSVGSRRDARPPACPPEWKAWSGFVAGMVRLGCQITSGDCARGELLAEPCHGQC